MDISFLAVLGISLGLTVALELVFALIFGVRGIRELSLVALVNVVTNPAVVLCYYLSSEYTQIPPVCAKIILEASAILAEWLLYKKLSGSIGRPFLFALCANLFSFGAGLAINCLI